MATSNLTQRRNRARSEEWQDEIDDQLSPSEKSSSSRRPTTPAKRAASRPKTTPRSPIASPRSSKGTRATRTPQRERLAPITPPTRTAQKQGEARIPPWLSLTVGTTFNLLLGIIRLVHVILQPVYPYLFLTVASLLLLSGAVYYLPSAISSLVYQSAGKLIRPLLRSATPDLTIGQDTLLLPLRSLSTPVCALTGQLCGLSLLGGADAAKPFWSWKLRTQKDEVDVGRVAREMAREVQGAKDIFDSLAILTGGGMMDRSEHVRIWELSVAVQVGSGLEEKEVVSEQLVHLGNVARDLSEALIETNVMAVDSFTWLQWEFSALVKALRAPPASRQSTHQLSARLNTLLRRLGDSLDKLHSSASNAFILAQKGSTTGQTLRTRLNPVVEDLRGQHERAPGWKLAVDKSKHFLTGGEISKAERISRDLAITQETIQSISGLVRGLEESRLGIKTFVSQIGYFQASMMGFHLGAGEQMGMGPEEEIEMLAQVVGELGRSVGRAKNPGLEDENLAIDP